MSISSSPGSIVFDLDGVVYLGSTPIPGATEAIETLGDAGWQILFATNNSTTTAAVVSQVLMDRLGLVVEPHAVITSSMAAASYLGEHKLRSAYIIGSPQLASTIRAAGITTCKPEDAEAVVVGIDRSLTASTIERASTAIQRGAVFVATNTDATFPTARGPIDGAGTTVDTIANASGGSPLVCGKPHEPMATLVSKQLTSRNVWMVGDRLETDIAFAKRAGWFSVLTLSGVTEIGGKHPQSLRPDYVIDSIADLPTMLAKATKSGRHEG